ncbi:hypothetical protein [Bacillus xiapuensis]|uniref:Uncharacterized protein n=1 Tax=Bacillus xiapuensis TaxID=2014075 RepID=A0ABU6NCF4_9BACI|nr:hypothetical protein [Bacillus xiapuensis]
MDSFNIPEPFLSVIEKQQKEIEQLKEELFIGKSNHFQCGYCVAAEEQDIKIEKYEKALKFYANKEYYEPFKEEDGDRTDAFNFIDLDSGETAREALGISQTEKE